MIQKRGALYIRVSTQEQAELSPDSQKRLLLEYAGEHGILVEPAHIFTESISGRRAKKRPRFLEMIALAKEHAFDVILVWKFSRFARNQEESIVYKNMLKRDQVEVVSISEPISHDPFGSLMERIIEWMDEYYSIRLSGDVFRGMTEKARRGGFQARPPLGYRIPRPGAPPEPVPEEAALVRQIFSWYVDCKKSPLEIARALNEAGAKTSSGGDFEARAVRYILKNPMYAGLVRWNVSSGSPIIRRGDFPPLISRGLFEAAAGLLGEPKEGRRPGSGKHWLSGLVKCSACGRSLAVTTRKLSPEKSSVSFQCWGYLKGKCPVSHQINGSRLERALLSALSRITMPDRFFLVPAAKKKAPGAFSGSLVSFLSSPSEDPACKARAIRAILSEAVYDSGRGLLKLRLLPFCRKADPMGLEGAGGPGLLSH